MGVEFADEFASGVPYTNAFAVQASLGVGAAALNAWTFLVPQAVALGIEPYLLLRSERWGTHRSLALGIAGMAASLLLGAAAPTAELLGLAVALYFPSSGLACGVAQMLLIEGSQDPAESLTDWTLAGTLGDLGTPLLFWLLDAAGFSWRATFGVVGLLLLLVAALAPYQRGGPLSEERALDAAAGASSADRESEEPSVLEAIRTVVGNRALLVWLLAAALCSLLDELLASQVGIYLAHGSGLASATPLVTGQLLAMGVGGAAGLLVQRRLLRRTTGRALLTATSSATVFMLGLWMAAVPGAGSWPLAALVGALIATHYPLTQAQAYALLPGRANLVAAASQAFSGIDLLYPVLVGFLSDAFHPGVGLAALLLQPLGILFALAATHRAAVRLRAQRKPNP